MWSNVEIATDEGKIEILGNDLFHCHIFCHKSHID
jgi:hypothetical protein